MILTSSWKHHFVLAFTGPGRPVPLNNMLKIYADDPDVQVPLVFIDF